MATRTSAAAFLVGNLGGGGGATLRRLQACSPASVRIYRRAPIQLATISRSYSVRWSSSGVRGTLSREIAQSRRLPLFTLQAKDLTLLEHPKDFYGHLLEIIARAKRHIFLASLYVGRDETELIARLDDALQSNSQLRLVVLIDGLRSTREGPYDGTDGTESCASLLAGLQARHGNRVEIRAFRASGLPAWLEKLVGKRFVEGYGLQHMKLYGNEEEVIVSGANLSGDYFTNRRDRYLRLRDRQISRYAYELLTAVGRFSFSLQATSAAGSSVGGGHVPYTLEWDEGRRLRLPVESDATGPRRWRRQLRHSILQLTDSWAARDVSNSPPEPSDTVDIVPLVQMGPMDIHQETDCLPSVLQAADRIKDSRLDFTTGYFSINPMYAKHILDGQFYTNMITASPAANGFFGSKGVSGHLPAAYTWLQHRFWRRLVDRGRDERVTIHEWNRQGWTYHAKGIWLFPSAKDEGHPALTLLGSSNFGIRSAKLDLECTFLIDATNSPPFRRRLAEEVKELQRHACDRADNELFARPERRVTLAEKVATWCIQRML